ncbi:class I SAM-dependent methyltransferase [Streptomyces sp. NPDC003691]
MTNPPRPRPATPQELFDRAAHRYDTFNSLLSLGTDRRWRRAAAAALPDRGHILDIATGTASLALATARRAPAVRVTGVDLNAAMLAVGTRRIRRAGLAGRITTLRARGEHLPFADAAFDGVSIAFAVDDMADRERCARESLRVLRPGGTLVLLELGLPEGRTARRLYETGLTAMTLFARLRGLDGYRHLREEILTYRGGDAVRQLLLDAGFTDPGRTPLTGGLAVLHTARRPLRPEHGGTARGGARGTSGTTRARSAEAPDTAGVPGAPEGLDPAGVPEPPELPGAEGMPGVPGAAGAAVPRSSGAPGTERAPGVPEPPGLARVPRAPVSPEPPGAAGVPGRPEGPDTAGVPEVPGAGAPGRPGAPATGSVPEHADAVEVRKPAEAPPKSASPKAREAQEPQAAQAPGPGGPAPYPGPVTGTAPRAPAHPAGRPAPPARTGP